MPTKKPASDIPKTAIERYDKIIATDARAERKGATIPYTSMNGHMFSQLEKDGSLILRLPPDDIAPFLAKHHTTLHTAYGIVRKEYVVVPDALFKNTKLLTPWFKKSIDYVAGLKPKPTTKKKSS